MVFFSICHLCPFLSDQPNVTTRMMFPHHLAFGKTEAERKKVSNVISCACYWAVSLGLLSLILGDFVSYEGNIKQ